MTRWHGYPGSRGSWGSDAIAIGASDLEQQTIARGDGARPLGWPHHGQHRSMPTGMPSDP